MIKYWIIILVIALRYSLTVFAETTNISTGDVVGQWMIVKTIDKNGVESIPEKRIVLVFEADYYGCTKSYENKILYNKLVSSAPFAYKISSNVLTIVEMLVVGTVCPRASSNTLAFLRLQSRYVVQFDNDQLKLKCIEAWGEKENEERKLLPSGKCQILKRIGK